MKEKWEVSKVSTPEAVFRKITEEVPQPVGIILFGADREFKNTVLKELAHNLPDSSSTIFYDETDDSPAHPSQDFEKHNIIIFAMETADAAREDLRKTFAENMRSRGAKTVIGVYAKVRQSAIRRYCFTSELPYLARATTFKELADYPPTAEGLDYLITVERAKYL